LTESLLDPRTQLAGEQAQELFDRIGKAEDVGRPEGCHWEEAFERLEQAAGLVHIEERKRILHHCSDVGKHHRHFAHALHLIVDRSTGVLLQVARQGALAEPDVARPFNVDERTHDAWIGSLAI
jgi:hypothetical protein